MAGSEIKYGMTMNLVSGMLNDNFNISGLLADQTSHRLIRNVQPIGVGTSSTYGVSNNGATAIGSGATYITVTGAGWAFIPTSVVASVSKPTGGDNIFATVREDSITADGFTADLSAPTPGTGYSLSYAVTQSTVTGTAGDLLDLGDVITPGLAMFVNLDTANYVSIGVRVGGVFYPFIKLLAGQYSGPVFLGTLAPCALANTAPVNLFYIIYDR